MRLGSDCMQEHIRIAKTMNNKNDKVVNLRKDQPKVDEWVRSTTRPKKDQNLYQIEMVQYSFGKDFALVCSIGFNIGFLVAIATM